MFFCVAFLQWLPSIICMHLAEDRYSPVQALAAQAELLMVPRHIPASRTFCMLPTSFSGSGRPAWLSMARHVSSAAVPSTPATKRDISFSW